jgi:hypothetical protein
VARVVQSSVPNAGGDDLAGRIERLKQAVFHKTA